MSGGLDRWALLNNCKRPPSPPPPPKYKNVLQPSGCQDWVPAMTTSSSSTRHSWRRNGAGTFARHATCKIGPGSVNLSSSVLRQVVWLDLWVGIESLACWSFRPDRWWPPFSPTSLVNYQPSHHLLTWQARPFHSPALLCNADSFLFFRFCAKSCFTTQSVFSVHYTTCYDYH